MKYAAELDVVTARVRKLHLQASTGAEEVFLSHIVSSFEKKGPIQVSVTDNEGKTLDWSSDGSNV